MANKITTSTRKRGAGKNFPRRFFRPRQKNDPEKQPSAQRANAENKNAWDKVNVGVTTAATVFIAASAIVTGIVAYYQWKALHATDEKIGEQVVALRQQLKLMENDQRPWINISKINVAEDVVFGGRGAQISLSFELANVGKSPAAMVDPWFSAFVEISGVSPPSWGGYKRPPIMLSDRAEGILFPNRSVSRTVTAFVPVEQVQQVVAGHKLFPVTIWLCADYRFVSSSEPHQTCHRLLLTRMDDRIISLADPVTPVERGGLKVTFFPYGSLSN